MTACLHLTCVVSLVQLNFATLLQPSSRRSACKNSVILDGIFLQVKVVNACVYVRSMNEILLGFASSYNCPRAL